MFCTKLISCESSGPCDNFTRSENLGVPVHTTESIGNVAWRLMCTLRVKPDDLRGAGIHLSKLVKQQPNPAKLYFGGKKSTASSAAASEATIRDVTTSSKDIQNAVRFSQLSTLAGDQRLAQEDEMMAYAAAASSHDELQDILDTDDISDNDVDCSDNDGPLSQAFAIDCSNQHVDSATSSNLADPAASSHQIRGNTCDFIPRLSQIDPEVLEALGQDWKSIVQAELASQSAQGARCNVNGIVSSTVSQPSTIGDSAPDDAHNVSRSRSVDIKVATNCSSAASSPHMLPQAEPTIKRRRVTVGRQQQTLLGMAADTAKWRRLQGVIDTQASLQWIRGLSKAKQLEMADEILAGVQPTDAMSTEIGCNQRKHIEAGEFIVCQPKQRDDVTMAHPDDTAPRERKGVCKLDPQRRSFQQAVRIQPQMDTTSALTEPEDTAALQTGGCATDDTAGRLLAHDTLDTAAAIQACQNLVASQPPCKDTVDVICCGLWQWIQDGRLTEVHSLLQQLRRYIAGSDFRPGLPLWASGYNVMLERAQCLSHARYGSFLKVSKIRAVQPMS